MSWRDPDHLPDLPNPDDGPERELCSVCEGQQEVDCGRDWQRMRCERCNGTGDEPEPDEFEPDYDYYEDRDL